MLTIIILTLFATAVVLGFSETSTPNWPLPADPLEVTSVLAILKQPLNLNEELTDPIAETIGIHRPQVSRMAISKQIHRRRDSEKSITMSSSTQAKSWPNNLNMFSTNDLVFNNREGQKKTIDITLQHHQLIKSVTFKQSKYARNFFKLYENAYKEFLIDVVFHIAKFGKVRCQVANYPISSLRFEVDVECSDDIPRFIQVSLET